ncbi:MAG: hypothetical protein V3V62_03180 [bacterium]
MRRVPALPLLAAALLLAAGCTAGQVRRVPLQIKFTGAEDAAPVRSPLRTVAIGIFHDARGKRASGPVGERVRFNGNLDQYTLAGGLPADIAALVRGYYKKRGVRILPSKWDGQAERIWDEKGDIVVSGRVTNLWFSGRDSITLAQAQSNFRIELRVGSPQTGTIITKTIQIEPERTRTFYWKTKAVEAWLSRTISEAIESVMPGIERRLVG